MAIRSLKVCGNPMAQRLLFLSTSGSTKTAQDKNKKSDKHSSTNKQASDQ
jgi:hypothetical protein